MDSPDALTRALERLERWGAGRDWLGPDPYEGLNSPLARFAVTPRARQVMIQAYKRFPIEPPWPLRTSPRPNAKTIALVLAGYASRAGRELEGADDYLTRLPVELRELSRAGGRSAWGYHFAVQTRGASYGAEVPNAIATCFVIDALLDLFELSRDDDHASLALGARPYLVSLFRAADRSQPHFVYTDLGSTLIHNANLLICGALARLQTIEPDPRAPQLIQDAAATSIDLQREDGLWAYGEDPALGWADNFHTAYTLEGLERVRRVFGVGGTALETGLAAWRRAFFDSDGWARYFPDRRYPLEPHCYASAIDLLCVREGSTGADSDARSFALRLAQRAIEELWLSDQGRFAFRRTRRGLNKRLFVRWTNAPMFRALARLSALDPGSGARPAAVR